MAAAASLAMLGAFGRRSAPEGTVDKAAAPAAVKGPGDTVDRAAVVKALRPERRLGVSSAGPAAAVAVVYRRSAPGGTVDKAAAPAAVKGPGDTVDRAAVVA